MSVQSFWDKFVDRVRTNTPLQLTLLAAILLIVSMILALFMNKGLTAAAIGVALVINIIIICFHMYVVHCVQAGNCVVLSYALAAFILVIAIGAVIGALLPDMKVPSVEGVFKMESSKGAAVKPISVSIPSKMKAVRSSLSSNKTKRR